MPRPAEHPDWATAPSSPTDIVRPPNARIQDGWNVAEKPPAQFFNWWQNLVSLWTRWLEEDLNAKNAALDARVRDIERRIVGDEWTYPAPKLRTVLLTPDDGSDATLATSPLPGWERASNILGPGAYFPLRARTVEAR